MKVKMSYNLFQRVQSNSFIWCLLVCQLFSCGVFASCKNGDKVIKKPNILFIMYGL